MDADIRFEVSRAILIYLVRDELRYLYFLHVGQCRGNITFLTPPIHLAKQPLVWTIVPAIMYKQPLLKNTVNVVILGPNIKHTLGTGSKSEVVVEAREANLGHFQPKQSALAHSTHLPLSYFVHTIIYTSFEAISN